MKRDLLTHVIENSGIDSGMDEGMTAPKYPVRIKSLVSISQLCFSLPA